MSQYPLLNSEIKTENPVTLAISRSKRPAPRQVDNDFQSGECSQKKRLPWQIRSSKAFTASFTARGGRGEPTPFIQARASHEDAEGDQAHRRAPRFVRMGVGDAGPHGHCTFSIETLLMKFLLKRGPRASHSEGRDENERAGQLALWLLLCGVRKLQTQGDQERHYQT